jgi:DNA-binding NarL/FixJ family response regulator
LESATIHVLVVDDYEPWRRFVVSALQKEPEFHIAGEACDGLEAVQKAAELQPDLVLLDIGLPTLNGIEAARRICSLSPKPKILFVSENRSPEIAGEALRRGGNGYVIKSSAASELLPAIRAVLRSEQFVSRILAALVEPGAQPVDRSRSDEAAPPRASRNLEISHRHEMALYSDDASFVDGFARGAEAALKNGNAVIVLASASHREGIFARLQAANVDVSAAVEQGSYTALDPANTLSAVMESDMPDPVRCAKFVGDLIVQASKSARGEHARVAFFGECAPTLLADGNPEAAVRLEHLWNELMRRHGAHTLCGYLSTAFPQSESNPVFQRICAKHSAVYQRN